MLQQITQISVDKFAAMPLVSVPGLTNDALNAIERVVEFKEKCITKYKKFAEDFLINSLNQEEHLGVEVGCKMSDVEQMGNYVLILQTLLDIVNITQSMTKTLKDRTRQPLKHALPELPLLRERMLSCSKHISTFNRLHSEGGSKICDGFEKDADESLGIALMVIKFVIKFDMMCIELKSNEKKKKRQRQKLNKQKVC